MKGSASCGLGGRGRPNRIEREEIRPQSQRQDGSEEEEPPNHAIFPVTARDPVSTALDPLVPLSAASHSMEVRWWKWKWKLTSTEVSRFLVRSIYKPVRFFCLDPDAVRCNIICNNGYLEAGERCWRSLLQLPFVFAFPFPVPFSFAWVHNQ